MITNSNSKNLGECFSIDLVISFPLKPFTIQICWKNAPCTTAPPLRPFLSTWIFDHNAYVSFPLASPQSDGNTGNIFHGSEECQAYVFVFQKDHGFLYQIQTDSKIKQWKELKWSWYLSQSQQNWMKSVEVVIFAKKTHFTSSSTDDLDPKNQVVTRFYRMKRGLPSFLGLPQR